MKFDYSMVHPNWDEYIRSLGRSQKGQDVTLKWTMDNIGTTNKYYVEFGAIDGFEDCNTLYFREKEGWNGLLLESGLFFTTNKGFKFGKNDSINLQIETVTKDNICDIFKKYNVPNQFDILSVDIDSMDYWVTKSLLSQYRPRCLMVEVNVRFEPDQSWRIKYNPHWNWDGLKWYGASPLAYKKMLNEMGYTPVHIHVDDMIAIRNDVLEEKGFDKTPWEEVYPHSNVPLYRTHNMGGTKPLVTELNLDEWEEV